MEEAGNEMGLRQSPANNPDNFRIAYHVWDDYPYRKANLIEGKDADGGDGFGPPSYTMYDEGENVRNAYLLNDTFELAAAGAATIADRDVVKDNLTAFAKGSGPVARLAASNGQADAKQLKLLEFLAEYEDNPPEFFKPDGHWPSPGRRPRCGTASCSRVSYRSHKSQRKAYPTHVIYAELDKLYSTLGGAG